MNLGWPQIPVHLEIEPIGSTASDQYHGRLADEVDVACSQANLVCMHRENVA